MNELQIIRLYTKSIRTRKMSQRKANKKDRK